MVRAMRLIPTIKEVRDNMEEIKEIKLMEMVIVLWLNDVISREDRERYLGYLQNRLDRDKHEKKSK